MFLKLAFKSLLNRKGSVLLTLLSMSISIFVLLGVEHIRHQAKESFASTVSGVDLIVGSRTGSINLLLYSVFHVGSPTNNIRWKTYENIAENNDIDWAIPISLGDSHRGYRVLGTTQNYFKHFKYSSGKQLKFEQGDAFNNVFDVVLGYDVAKRLGYQLNEKIIIAHGIAKTSFTLHDNNPFTITGILARTGTPVDQTVHISLQGIEAIHHEGQHLNTSLDKQAYSPSSITAIMLGLKSKMATFKVQRLINNDSTEPLTSILPGVALIELWQMMGLLENILRLISAFVLVASLLGLSAMLLTSIRERHHEIHLLRIMGASPSYLFLLIQLEAILISAMSIVLGAGSLWMIVSFANEAIASQFGFFTDKNILTTESLYLLLSIILLTTISSMVPAITGYIKAKHS